MWKHFDREFAETQRVCQVLAAAGDFALVFTRIVCVNYCSIGVSSAAEERSFVPQIAAAAAHQRNWATRIWAAYATKTGGRYNG
jgi:hypothetical protein